MVMVLMMKIVIVIADIQAKQFRIRVLLWAVNGSQSEFTGLNIFDWFLPKTVWKCTVLTFVGCSNEMLLESIDSLKFWYRESSVKHFAHCQQ